MSRPVPDLEKAETSPSPAGAAQSADDASESKDVDAQDVVIVDWEGEGDPANPLNWTRKRKAIILFILSLFTFCSPLSATYVSGVSSQLAVRYNIQSEVLLAMLTSSFFIAFALGPLLLAPLSEMYGRVPVTQFAATVVVISNLVTPWAPNPAVFIVFRLFAGFGASSPLAVGAGIIADVFRSTERGRAVALWSLFPLLGPVLGPLLGGFVQDYTSWHWVFWSIAITMGFCQVLAFFVFQECYGPVLLQQKAREMQAHTSVIVKTKFSAKYTSFSDLVLSLVNLVMFGLLFLMLVTIGGTFVRQYGWTQSKAGLMYLPLGLGVLVMSQTQGFTSDRIAISMTRKNNNISKPEFRLPWLFPSTVLLPLGFLTYGWSAQYRVHWVVPGIGLFLIGAGNIGFMQPTQVYAIECFPLYAASALAAILTFRSFAGFAFPLFGDKLTSSLGLGGGSSLLAGMSIIVCGGSITILGRYGERLRKASKMGE